MKHFQCKWDSRWLHNAMYMGGGDWLEIGSVVSSKRHFYCCHAEFILRINLHGDRLMQERRNSSALAMELCLSCSNSLILCHFYPRPVLWPSGIVVACVCVCFCLCACQPWAYAQNNSSPVQVRTNKLGQKMQNTLSKIPINVKVDWPRPSQTHLI